MFAEAIYIEPSHLNVWVTVLSVVSSVLWFVQGLKRVQSVGQGMHVAREARGLLKRDYMNVSGRSTTQLNRAGQVFIGLDTAPQMTMGITDP